MFNFFNRKKPDGFTIKNLSCEQGIFMNNGELSCIIEYTLDELRKENSEHVTGLLILHLENLLKAQRSRAGAYEYGAIINPSDFSRGK